MFDLNPARAPERNPGYARVFAQPRLTLGLLFPIEAFQGDTPNMQGQVELAQFAEAAGFDALWFRDVPLRVPSFGDVGQVFDPFVYLGYMAAQTSRIALGTAAIIMPLRHPLHTAKAAASVDQLSGGRLVLGVASGDRPVEFPAFGRDLEERAELFRDSVRDFRTALTRHYPVIRSRFGRMEGADLIPKPVAADIPLLVTGRSGQSLRWIAEHVHGWLSYPRSPGQQAQLIAEWRDAQEGLGRSAPLPFAQSLYIDLVEDRHAAATPIHLGYRLGREALVELLVGLARVGVAHVIFNLKYGQRHAASVLQEIASGVLPRVHERTGQAFADTTR
ncbi:MAG: LLM class oxidoreductase [Piscinibacter sp.]|nr:LLM class oxidoreductase [Piscinibacter sp.]